MLTIKTAVYDENNEDQPWRKFYFSDGAFMDAGEKAASIWDKDGELIESIYKSTFYKTEHGRLYEECSDWGFGQNPNGDPIIVISLEEDGSE